MSDVPVTILLSEELLKRVHAAGLEIEDLPRLIDEHLQQHEAEKHPAFDSFTELADRIAALPDNLKPTPDEIDDEIRAVREEIAAERRTARMQSYALQSCK